MRSQSRVLQTPSALRKRDPVPNALSILKRTFRAADRLSLKVRDRTPQRRQAIVYRGA
jgi:hypothetical protein